MDANKPRHTSLSIIEQPGLAANQYSANTPQYTQFGEGRRKSSTAIILKRRGIKISVR